MKNKIKWLILLGVLIIIFGISTLLNIWNLKPFGQLFWGVLHTFGGLLFIIYLLQNRNARWAIIPGVVLIGLGFDILVAAIFPKFSAGSAFPFLLGITVAFLIVYWVNNKSWWAIIPAGVAASQALSIFVDRFTHVDGDVVFWLGITLTFALLTILPELKGNRKWPLIPVGIFLSVGLLALISDFNLSNLVWAVPMMLLGVILVIRSLLQKKQAKEEV